MDKEQKEHKRVFDHISIGLAILKIICQKFGSDKDGVGWRRILLVYSWIWDWQVFTKVGFGKMRKKDVYTEIEQKLLEPKPHIVVGALIRAGLVTWGRGDYEGKKNYCLQCTYLNEKMKNNDTNTRQAENEAIQIESSAKGSAEMGEYYQYGKRFYRDNKGESHIIPLDAPQRPNNTAFWDGKQWRESDSAMQKQQNVFDNWLRVPKNGVYYDSGRYYYKDANGNSVWVPDGVAFDRPSTEHVFDSEADRWCLPNEVTVHELEF